MVDGTGYEELYTYNTADGSLSSMKVNGEDLIFSYNALKQLSKRTSPRLDVEYAYGTTGDGFTTNQVTAIRYRKHGETTYRLPRLDYTYDAVGNIKTVTPLDKATVTYEYDTQNKLRKETKGTTVEGIYDIDTYGNIRSKQWKDSNGVRNYTFTYGTGGSNDAWMDQIKTVTFDNGSGTPVTKTLSYDVLGNPTKYYNGEGEWDFTWQYGRQLATAKKTGTNTTIINTYDVDGIRDSKTVGSVKHTYTTLSGKIIREKYGTTTIDYLYDNEGRPYKLILDLNGTKIHGYFALNLQGDVIAIIDSTGEVAVTYEYDAWGREIVSSTAGDYGSRLYAENRLKYRGYYYDSETGFYYVSSRYYDPEVGRFISADGEISGVGGDILGYNLFAYCQNNPVNMSDPDGNWPKWATKVAIGVGVALCVAAVTVLTCGAGTATLAGAVAVGAAKGALIGAAAGAAIGAGVGYKKTKTLKGAGKGAAIGFGIGASVGAAVGGGIAGAKFGTFSSKASLTKHFDKHGSEFKGIYDNVKEYAKGAKYVIKNGTYIPEKNAYVRFLGSKGKANYAFVGMKSGGRVSTFHVRSVSAMTKDGITLFVK